MNIWGRDLAIRQIAACLVFILAAQLSYASPLPPQQGIQQPPASATQIAESGRPGAELPQAPTPQQPANPPAQQQPDQSQSAQKPVGTAAAPVTRPSGVAGSRPAGAAIAPAKQRRVRRILIHVGIIVGGAAALGTVIALSHGSPSRP